ncbi:beta/gamma crystallin family protein [Caulobacter segnis]|uniref:beta/gamma crystallin family protein n=1 Tax=Caulobacter segnis TaxID=88688 RepID=UPI001CBBA3FA|nr:beta/gamma crystallin family protein [Caulobacter segnis]UAL11793.1 beta/gamma crystallin family protein [Caulobacter segnis]
MRKTAFLITCGAVALLSTGAFAQDRDHGGDRRDDRYDRRDDRRDDRRGRWGVDLVVFEHRDFGGDSRPIRGEEPDLTRIGFNDRISSLRVMRGQWEFCEHAYFQGRCWRYDYDAGVLPNKQNDRFSSIRRIR